MGHHAINCPVPSGSYPANLSPAVLAATSVVAEALLDLTVALMAEDVHHREACHAVRRVCDKSVTALGKERADLAVLARAKAVAGGAALLCSCGCRYDRHNHDPSQRGTCYQCQACTGYSPPKEAGRASG